MAPATNTKLTDPIKDKITKILKINPKFSVQQIHNILVRDVRYSLIKKFHKSNPEYTDVMVAIQVDERIKKLPGTSRIDKWLRKEDIRNKIFSALKKPGKLDLPWNLAASNLANEIPNNMTPILIEYMRLYRKQPQPSHKDIGKLRFDDPAFNELIEQALHYGKTLSRLTIRKAQWMCRIYPLICDPERQDARDNIDRIPILSLLADIYADSETALASPKTPFDSSKIDEMIFGDNYNLMNSDLASFEAQIGDSMDYIEVFATPELPTSLFEIEANIENSSG
jgi:hypothetical protein